MEWVVPVCLGIGLAAACGFRVFVPMLGLSAASLGGYVQLIPAMEWVGTWPALVCFLAATVVEVCAYYFPWVDNLLDTLASPAAAVAGTMVMGSVLTDMSPMMRWSLALIAGGGIASLIQLGTVGLRGGSTATTLGVANPVVSTGELVMSSVTTVAALILPVLACLSVVLIAFVGLMFFYRRSPKKAEALTDTVYDKQPGHSGKAKEKARAKV